MIKKMTLLLFVVLLIPTSLALAEGNFDYIIVKGPGLQGELNLTNPELTSFLTFADFTQGAIDPPANPGEGYEITRVYVVMENEKPDPTAFDQLYYYPYSDDGYVYYIGLAKGSSEYDRKWYEANLSADAPFRAALAARARVNWVPFAVLIVILAVFLVAYYRKPNK
ncbi:MAG TPA: hypothetical protein VIS72_00250 [Anaerolineales bacterium]